jgi:hypothetical protein
MFSLRLVFSLLSLNFLTNEVRTLVPSVFREVTGKACSAFNPHRTAQASL